MSSNMILELINFFNINNNPVKGKKALHKLIYFMSLKDYNYNFDYKLYLYGPYSFDLENEFLKLQESNAVEIHCTDDYNSTITINAPDKITFNPDNEKLNWLLRECGDLTPEKLELLCTTHYVVNSLIKIHNIYDEDKFVQTVKSVKASKFTDVEIKQAITRLKDLNVI